MPIRYQHVVNVAATPEKAFAVIDDLPATSKWLPPCVNLSKVGEGPNTPGDKLHYVMKQGGASERDVRRNTRSSAWPTSPLQMQRRRF